MIESGRPRLRRSHGYGRLVRLSPVIPTTVIAGLAYPAGDGLQPPPARGAGSRRRHTAGPPDRPARDRLPLPDDLRVRLVADAAQQVVPRPLPDRFRNVEIESLYLAAAAEARIGGDFYEVVDTPYGVRLLIGDGRGKGLPAVGAAAAIVNAFRDDGPACLELLRPRRAARGRQGTGRACSAQIVLPVGM
ncbi:hypothetical protein ACH4TP_07315 [Streptomyces sp. NPDC021012]|uniref:hypothetical protein n=1 Tax=Streptomyces sp. NPDC021012 TaxID=3365107 RepID=UPI0037A8E459